jgi:hypothetical protein
MEFTSEERELMKTYLTLYNHQETLAKDLLKSLILRNIVAADVTYINFINNRLLMKMISLEIQLTLPKTAEESKYGKQFGKSDFWLSNQTDGTIISEFKHTNDLKLVADIKSRRVALYKKLRMILNTLITQMDLPETPRKLTNKGKKTPEDLSTEVKNLTDMLVCLTNFKYFDLFNFLEHVYRSKNEATRYQL